MHITINLFWVINCVILAIAMMLCFNPKIQESYYMFKYSWKLCIDKAYLVVLTIFAAIFIMSIESWLWIFFN